MAPKPLAKESESVRGKGTKGWGSRYLSTVKDEQEETVVRPLTAAGPSSSSAAQPADVVTFL